MINTGLGRRHLLKLIGGGLGADLLDGQHHSPENRSFKVPVDYQPRFFSQAEYELAAEICEIIIPSDAGSSGAKGAGVPWFIDTVLLYADPYRQRTWRSGLTTLDLFTASLYGKVFLACSPAQRVQVVQVLTENEELARTPEENFFGELKAIAVEGFCLSDDGMRDYLGYRGNTAIAEFPGCPHGGDLTAPA